MTERQKRSALQGAPLLYCNLLFFGFAAIFFHDMVVGTNQAVSNPIQLFGFLIMVEQFHSEIPAKMTYWVEADL